MKRYNYNEMIKRINNGIYDFDNIYLSVMSIVGELDINSFNNINDENIFSRFIFNYLNDIDQKLFTVKEFYKMLLSLKLDETNYFSRILKARKEQLCIDIINILNKDDEDIYNREFIDDILNPFGLYILMIGEKLGDLFGEDDFSLIDDALKNDNLHMFKSFINNGDININTRNYRDETILHIASINNATRIIEYLISQSVNVNSKTYNGIYPIHYACRYGHIEAFELLINAGSSLSVKDIFNTQPLALSILCQNIDFIDYLIKNKYVDDIEGCIDKNSATIAIQTNNLMILKHLIYEGLLNPSKVLDIDISLLSLAIDNDNISLVKFLINHGVDINQKLTKGLTPLHYAVINNKYEMVKYYIENGADVNSVTEDGKSIILNAVGNSSFEIFELLVNSGIDLKSDIKRILEDATALKKEKIIRLLIEKNIDMNIILERNTTPLLNVIIRGYKNLINTLLEVSDINYHNENDIALIANLAFYKDYKLMKELIDRGADVNISINKVTALHNVIAKKAPVSILKLLIEKDANIEAVGPRGITPLHNAVIVNYLDAVKLLVESGADVNAIMAAGNTPLGLARAKKYKGIYKYLKRNGANNYKQDLIIAITIFISVLIFVPLVLKFVFG